VGSGTEDICEPSRSTPGIVSESGSRRSVKGSTLRRWMAATTPAAVSPPSRSSCKASRSAGGGHHSLRKRWEPPIVVPKVKPPALPPLVRRGKDGGDVLLRTRLPQLEDAATGPHRRANSPLPCRQGKRLGGEEMGPQIPVGVNPQKPFTNRREDGCLRDGVGAEIVQLHPVEMQNRPHETTRWHSEPPLVERNETQHIPRRRGWGDSARRGRPLRLRVTREGTKQAIGNKSLQIIHRDSRERPRVARRDDGHPIGHHQAKYVAAERTRCTTFFLWLFPSGCGNLSRRRAAK
jgi:hypothetical protein